MKILFLSQLIPYPVDAGPKMRIYHVLQYLARAGHEVTLVAFRRPGDRPADIEHLRRYCHAVHTVLLHRSRLRDLWHLVPSIATGQPFLVRRDSVSAMHRLVRELLAGHRFDAVHADQLWMAQYALAARDRLRIAGQPKIVLDQHNAMYLIPRRMATGTGNPLKRALLALESRNLGRYEVDLCHLVDHVVWVTDEDRAAVARLANGRGSVPHEAVIPICIDPESRRQIPRQTGGRRVTFLGGLHWPPNSEGILWFAREVWPRVLSRVPDARLTVIGKQAPTALLHPRSSVTNIEVTGYLPDPVPLLSETGAFIVPLHAGGGMRVKILDAWSWGVPIVSTRIGAEGLHYRAGEELLIADDAASFAGAVVRLLQEPGLGERLAANGRRAVERHYDWRHVYRAWDDVYGTTGP